MHERASRPGMRELTVRAMVHGAALGSHVGAEVAGMLARDADTPVLCRTAANLT